MRTRQDYTPGAGGFAGFRPAAFAFLRDLRRHNDPDWFKPRKAVYEAEILVPFRALVAAVGEAVQAAGIPLVGDPGKGIFRIYRDVRFSPDKRPYKTHAGGVLTRSGNKRDPGLLYLHFEPGASRVGAGFWHPAPDLLARLRHGLVADPERFLAIAEGLAAAGHALSSDARLSRPPRGFEIDRGSPIADYLCWKSFTAHGALSDEEMQSPAAIDRILAFTRDVLPFLQWGWSAVEGDIQPALPIRLPARPLPPPDF